MPDRVPSLDSPPTHEPNYRAEIDGLRAFAVLAVLGFHAGIPAMRGGFVGVDVFFVISGYLISGIIFKALEKGTFSFSSFYARRINRIFPALIVVLVATVLIGWLIMFAQEFASLGKHTFGGSAFVSNILLWRETGYFDSPTKPLLHLWSLAVEEQFYIVWPLIVVFVWKAGWSIGKTLLAIAAISFASGVAGVIVGQTSAVFYAPVTRFWEILAGALLLHAESSRGVMPGGLRRLGQRYTEAAAVTGLALLLISVATARETMPWPGWWALVPITGTLLLVAAGQDAWINRRVLATRPAVAIGLISYPLYLWHWPLIVVAKLVSDGEPKPWMMGAVLAASFLLAFATFRLVELPIRFGRRKRRSAAILLPVMGAVGVLGLVIHRGVIRSRLDQPFSQAAQQASTDEAPGGEFTPLGTDIVVLSLPGDTSRSVAFVGDSHMAQYWPRFVELARGPDTRGPHVMFMTFGGCPPFSNVNARGNAWDGAPHRCDKFYRHAMERINRPNVKAVVLGGWWEEYLTKGNLYDVNDPAKSPILALNARGDSLFAIMERDIARFRRAGKRVYIVLSNPSSPFYNPRSMLPGRLPGMRPPSRVRSISRAEFESRVRPIMDRLRQVAIRGGAVIIDPVQYLCDASQCATVDEDDSPIYRDDHHLRATYAAMNAVFMDQVLAGAR